MVVRQSLSVKVIVKYWKARTFQAKEIVDKRPTGKKDMFEKVKSQQLIIFMKYFMYFLILFLMIFFVCEKGKQGE